MTVSSTDSSKVIQIPVKSTGDLIILRLLPVFGKILFSGYDLCELTAAKLGFHDVGAILARSDMLPFTRYSHQIWYFTRNG
jgi:hypothetical protein